eukprot:TRINITY_DN76344_c0_g1_i1.p1 TRINITY_DN76344_c0_g1~~TRINITY_DN76344_c0_g1_i1.p1  ORF type:complete len:828 (+),score=153.29 TRINITY_DN76344_c0_g1_i1:84-2567(+)
MWVLSLLFALAAAPGAAVLAPTEASCATPDAPLGVAGDALLQRQVLHKRHQTLVSRQVMRGDDVGVDEPESAPRWYITLAIGVGAAMLIFAIMVLLLAGLQVLVRMQQRYQEELVMAASKDKKAVAGATRSADEEEVKPTFDDREAMALVNGDEDRLYMLLELASAKDAQQRVADMVAKCAKAQKLSLSKDSTTQISDGVMLLAKKVQSINQKKTSESENLTPKEKLQKAMRQVRSMVRTCRALSVPHSDHAERKMMQEQDENVTSAYMEGAKQGTRQNVKATTQSTLGSYFASEKWLDHAGIGLILVWSQLCGLVYALYLKQRFPKMYDFMGPWILVSRGEAMSIIVLTCLMILLMTRGFTTWIRNHCYWSTVLENLVDKHALMHQWCGIFLPFCAALHVLGHLRGSIPAIINEKDNARINEVFTYGTEIKFNFNTWSEAARCYPAVTGVVLIVLLIGFWSLSNEWVRRKNFELFHYPHLILVVAWALGLWAHGARQWLGCGVPLGLLCVVPLVLYYAIERISNITRGLDPNIRIVNAIIKKKSVMLEIETAGSGYTYTTGMYCMLKVPDVSGFQWHPFTIASAGGSTKVQILFALAGDWTTQFKELLEDAQKNKKPYPVVGLRGGYGAPAQSIKNEKHVVMVGAGVGATPFLSFLASVTDDAVKGYQSRFAGVESAVFYWMSREVEDFAWVNQYNSIIAATPSLRDKVSVRLVLTKALETSDKSDCNATEVAMFWMGTQVALLYSNAKALSRELGAPTQFGRPNWKKELGKHYEELLEKGARVPGEVMKIGVFACGNKMLTDSLEEACDALDTEEVDFRLFAEQF